MRKDPLKSLLVSIILILMILSTAQLPSGLDSMRGPSSSTMAHVNVNVTYPDGGPASYVYLRIHGYDRHYSDHYSEKGFTNISGQDSLEITSWNLGPCFLTVYNSSRSSFSRFRLDIWPGDEIFMDVVLTTSMEDNITIFGSVFNGNSTTPIPQTTTVTIHGKDSMGREFERSSEAMVDGSYSIDIPPSDTPILIEASVSHPLLEFMPFSSYFYYGNSEDNRMDITLSMVSKNSVEVDLRFMDSNKGGPIDDGDMISYSGFEFFNDHGETEQTHLWSGSNGWRNISLGMGEYLCRWRHHFNFPMNSMVEATVPIIVNSTPISREVPIPVPDDFRPVMLEVLDHETNDPLAGATVSFDYETEKQNGPRFEISSTYIESNGTGIAPFYLIADEEVDIRISRWDRETKIITVPTGKIGEFTNLTVHLVEKEMAIPEMGTISVKVVDDPTGIPIPYAHVEGNGMQDPFLGFEGLTGNDGYLNSSVQKGTYRVTADSSLGSTTEEDVTIENGEETSLLLELNRREFEKTEFEILLTLQDPQGAPLAFQPISFIPVGSGSTYSTGSDGQGKVRALLPKGDYILKNIDEFDHYSIHRPHWIVSENNVVKVTGNEDIGAITLQPADPMSEISGFVKEKETGKPLPFRMVESSSFRGDVMVFSETSGSVLDGFYRTWGTGIVEIYCESEGYFPHRETIDLNTRSPRKHDIILEPMKEYSTWFNGTLVDKDDNPVQGEVRVLDNDRSGFAAKSTETSSDGSFSMMIYPGNFTVEYWNATVENEALIEIPPEGLNGIKLVLKPFSPIEGTVADWKGDAIPVMPVSLLEIGMEGNTTLDEVQTDSSGGFEFLVEQGTYFLRIQGNDLYEEWESSLLIATGFNEFELNIELENRTTSTVYGKVLPGGGPYPEGIPGASVKLLNGTGYTVRTTISNSSGDFVFEDVDHGTNYRLQADPPLSMLAREITYRSGLFSNTTMNFVLSGISKTQNITLPFREFKPPGYFNITSASPDGTGILLDEPIRLSFSEPVNRSSLAENLRMIPAVGKLTFLFHPLGELVEVHHDTFGPMMEYTISISTDLLSEKDSRLWGRKSHSFNFTTGSDSGSWKITGAFTDVDPEKNWNVTAMGPKDQQVYLVIPEIGSFQLTEVYRSEISSEYFVEIEGDLFEWNTTYAYHFSSSDGGRDMAVEFSGWVRTIDGPIRVPEEWKLTSADAEILENGDLLLTVEGNRYLTVYMVVDGIGSFLIGETSPGVYSTTIPRSAFEEGTSYEYHFSNSEGGENLAPELQGSFKTNKREEDDREENMFWILLLIIAAVLLLIGISLIFMWAAGRRSGQEDWEE